MALIGAVNDATMGAELEFREKCGPAVVVVGTFIVLKEDCTLVIWENELGYSNNNGKSQFMHNKFIKTNHIGIVSGILKYIPVSTKKSSVTTTICHNNGFSGREVGDEGMYFGRVHIDTDSPVRWRVGSGDSHAKEVGSFMSGLVTV